MMTELTQNHFQEFKRDYDVYGTETKTDQYMNEYTEISDTPKETIHVMWQPMTDYIAVVEYGRRVTSMFYCILYEDKDIDYNDIVIIDGDEYEVVGMKLFNTYTRIEVEKKAANS